MSQPDFDTMTDAELADYQYAHRDDPLGAEADLLDVEMEIAHPLSVSMSFRLPPQEASASGGGAERSGMTMSDWDPRGVRRRRRREPLRSRRRCRTSESTW